MTSEVLIQPNFSGEFFRSLDDLKNRLIGGSLEKDRGLWDGVARVGRQWWQIDKLGFQESLSRQFGWSKEESGLIAKLFGTVGVKENDKWDWLYDALGRLGSQVGIQPSGVDKKIESVLMEAQGATSGKSRGNKEVGNGEWEEVPVGREPPPEKPDEEVKREERRLERIREQNQTESGKKAERQILVRRMRDLLVIIAAIYTFLGPKGWPNPGMDALKWLANLKEEFRDVQIDLGGEERGDDRDPQLARVRDWVREWGRPKLEADYISTRNSMQNVLEGNGDLKREVEFFNEAGKEGDWQQQVVMREGWEHAFWRSLKPAVNNDGIFSEAEMEAIEDRLIQSGISPEEVEEFMSVLQESNKFQIK